jgi:hypothetical protein
MNLRATGLSFTMTLGHHTQAWRSANGLLLFQERLDPHDEALGYCLPARRLQRPPIRGRGGHEPNETVFRFQHEAVTTTTSIQGEEDASGYWLPYCHANRSSM